jgi:hypothetical protein
MGRKEPDPVVLILGLLVAIATIVAWVTRLVCQLIITDLKCHDCERIQRARNCARLEDSSAKECHSRSDIHVGASSMSAKWTTPTALRQELFCGPGLCLVEEIILRSGLDPIERQSGYIKLCHHDRAMAEVDSLRRDGWGDVCLIVRASDQTCPRCSILRPVPCHRLRGFVGPNKSWLLGDGVRYTNRPAQAFLLPDEMCKQPDHLGWAEVDALIEYARSR